MKCHSGESFFCLSGGFFGVESVIFFLTFVKELPVDSFLKTGILRKGKKLFLNWVLIGSKKSNVCDKVKDYGGVGWM